MKIRLILPLLLGLSGCSSSPAENLADASAAFERNDFTEARILAAAALSAEPTNKAALMLQAKSLIALGDGQGAGSALARLAGNAAPTDELAELAAEAALLRQSPEAARTFLGSRKSVEAERLRALAAIQDKKAEVAGDHFATAMTLGGNARTFADYARFRLLAGDVSGAEELVARAVKAAPNGLDTLLVRGQLALHRGDLKAGLDAYRRARTLYPTSLAAIVGEAAALGDLGRYDEMKTVIATALKLAPQDIPVAYLAARAGVATRDWAAARAAVQPVEAALPQHHPLRVIYGESLLRLGQNELAIAQLSPIARVQPGNRLAVRLLAEAQLAAGDARAAVVTLRPIADRPEARAEELTLMARVAAAAKDPRADSYAKRAKAPPVQSLGADLAEADAAMRKGDWAKAVIAYDRIQAQTDGRNAVVLNNLAYAQSMLGEHAKARALADQAVKLAPGNASVLDTAGWVRWRSGLDRENAKRLLRQAAEKAPNNATIRAHLAEAERAG